MQRDRLVARGIDIAPYPLSHLAVRVADWDLGAAAPRHRDRPEPAAAVTSVLRGYKTARWPALGMSPERIASTDTGRRPHSLMMNVDRIGADARATLVYWARRP
jgi:hypothetical protein